LSDSSKFVQLDRASLTETSCARWRMLLNLNIVTIHTAGRMYRQTRHGMPTRPRLGLGLGLGLEFAHGRACASLLTFFIHTAGRVYNISQI